MQVEAVLGEGGFGVAILATTQRRLVKPVELLEHVRPVLTPLRLRQ